MKMKRILKLPIKRKWLAALRSGKYKQGTNGLRTNSLRSPWRKPFSSFCCLGVLADVVDPEGWQIKRPHDEWAHRGEVGLLSLRVCGEACRMHRSEVSHFFHDAMPTLAEMNDSGKTFKQIAKWIEKNL